MNAHENGLFHIAESVVYGNHYFSSNNSRLRLMFERHLLCEMYGLELWLFYTIDSKSADGEVRDN